MFFLGKCNRLNYSRCLVFVSSGPRPPSDPHGRYAENKHISGMGMSYAVSLFKILHLSLCFAFLTLWCFPSFRHDGPPQLITRQHGWICKFLVFYSGYNFLFIPFFYYLWATSSCLHVHYVCPCSKTDTSSRSTG